MPPSDVIASSAIAGVRKTASDGGKDSSGEEGAGANGATGLPSWRGNYENVLAIVNPLAGETSTSGYITESLVSFLGRERVISLSKELFASPGPLHAAICKYAVRYESDEAAGEKCQTATKAADRRGTVFVSGGDGTVSYMMEQLDAVREAVEMVAKGSRDGDDAPRGKPILPALAVLAYGTGNDFSNCVGFGRGYSRGRKCGPLCGENVVEDYVQKALSARSTPFDRWVVQVVPLSVVWRKREQGWGGDEGRKTPSLAGQCSSGASSSLPDLFIDWDSLLDDPECNRYHFINYFSVGFDAYVAHKFGSFRKKNPKFCSKRWKNKLVYCCYSIRAAMGCSPLKKHIPNVWVNDMAGEKVEVSSSAGSARACAEGGTRMSCVRLPGGSKTLMITNVTSYAAGTKPWNSGKGKLYRKGSDRKGQSIQPVCVNDRKLEVQTHSGLFHMGMMQMSAGGGAYKISQTNDVIFFVSCSPEDICEGKRQQLQAQKDEMKFFKLNLEGSVNTLKGSKEEEKDEGKEIVFLQVDGEPVPNITRPSIVRVRELCKPRVYVRCLNEEVLLPMGPGEEEEGKGM